MLIYVCSYIHICTFMNKFKTINYTTIKNKAKFGIQTILYKKKKNFFHVFCLEHFACTYLLLYRWLSLTINLIQKMYSIFDFFY